MNALANSVECERMVDVDPNAGQISADEFKSVMRRLAASVNVITSANEGIMNGMTATAVCSVTANPPSALIVVNKSNRSHPFITRSQSFAVNVLSAEQQLIADHFASRPNDPFAQVPHRVGRTGCPLIEGADAHIECVVMNEIDVGTHTVFIGRIVSADAAEGAPLLYHAGRYLKLP